MLMSRAFVKEDVDPPLRSGRVRSRSGLPPGALNYITANGAARLKRELADLRRGTISNAGRIAELEQILASVTIAEVAEDPGQNIAFGAKVTIRDSAGRLTTYRIVGVDELDLYSDAVSWISSIGKTLLSAEIGHRVTLEDHGIVQVAEVKYPTE
jgi:transcription elongation GreA/GreB family factor